MKKKFLALLLSLSMISSFCVPGVFAEGPAETVQEPAAVEEVTETVEKPAAGSTENEKDAPQKQEIVTDEKQTVSPENAETSTTEKTEESKTSEAEQKPSEEKPAVPETTETPAEPENETPDYASMDAQELYTALKAMDKEAAKVIYNGLAPEKQAEVKALFEAENPAQPEAETPDYASMNAQELYTALKAMDAEAAKVIYDGLAPEKQAEVKALFDAEQAAAQQNDQETLFQSAYDKLMAAETSSQAEEILQSIPAEQQEAFLSWLEAKGLMEAVQNHLNEVYSAEYVAPVTVVLTAAGPFMPAIDVYPTVREAALYGAGMAQEDGPIKTSKVVKANDDGTFTITLETYTTGKVVDETTSTPVDVVLVLDQSGSMCYDFNDKSTLDYNKSRQKAMKDSVNYFINNVASKYSPEADHRISIVTFGSNAKIYQGWTKVDAAGKKTLNTKINSLSESPEGATNTGAGMQKAEHLMGKGYNYTGSNSQRQKVVILFTDGVPTTSNEFSVSVANAAIKSAKNLKDNGVTVYSVGIFTGADPAQTYGDKGFDHNSDGTKGSKWYDDAFFLFGSIGKIDIPAGNRFLNYVSSNYKTASEIGIKNYSKGFITISEGWEITKDPIKATGSNYYLSADNARSLNEIFNSISQQISTPDIELGSETIIEDVVSKYFTAPANASEIKLYTAAATSNGFAARVPLTGAAPSVNGNKISVTGFNFDENFVSSVPRGDNNFYGKKLIIEFKVAPKSDFIGGNNVPTNDSAAVMLKGKKMASFPVPQANVPIQHLSVFGQDKNVYLNYTLTGAELKQGVTAKYGENNFTASTPLEFVNAQIQILDKEGAVVTQLANLLDDTSYRIKITVSPKTNGRGAAGKPAVKTEGISDKPLLVNVFKPVIPFKDSVIDLGETADYSNNLAADEIKWMHGVTASTHEGIVMLGTADSLALEYDPAAAAFTEDTPVKVSKVKMFGSEVPMENNVTFEHKECTFPGCKWGQEGFTDCQFIVHINSFDLTITKAASRGTTIDPNAMFRFVVTGPDNFTAVVTIRGEGSATIKNLRAGQYTVTEDTSWSWRYTPAQSSMQANASNSTVTFYNSLGNDHWVDGETSCENMWNGNTITAK